MTDYILERPACPFGRREIFEKSLVEPCAKLAVLETAQW